MREKERRETPRLQAKPGTYVTYIEGTGSITDLSMKGMFVLDSSPLPVGSKISFTLRIGGQVIPLKGIVRRTVDGHGMAIEFEDLSAAVKNRLRSCISSML